MPRVDRGHLRCCPRTTWSQFALSKALREFGSGGVKRQRPEPVFKETLAQLFDLFRIGHSLGDSKLREVGTGPDGLGSSGPVLHPGVNDGVIHQPLFDVVRGQKAPMPGRPARFELLRVFIPQNQRLGPQAVRDGVETRDLLSGSVRGPVLLAAFRRLASSLASEIVMS